MATCLAGCGKDPFLVVPLPKKTGRTSDRPPPPAATVPVPSAPAGHVDIVKAAPDGPVASVVRLEMDRAQREGRKLLVYVGAKWCEPCQKFHQAAEAGKLDGDFGDLRLLEFDLDHDRDRLAAQGYSSQLIPLFAVPGPDGSASGKSIQGSIKGDGAVDEIRPRLRQLIGG